MQLVKLLSVIIFTPSDRFHMYIRLNRNDFMVFYVNKLLTCLIKEKTFSQGKGLFGKSYAH